MAKKTNLNVSVGVDTTAYRKGWEEVAKITVAGGQQTEKEAEKMVNAMTKKFEKLSLKQQIRQFEQLAGKMEQAGQSGTKAFSDVIKKTGDLKAAQDDLKGLIDAARPDAPFKALSNALQTSAQAYAGVVGGMQLLGIEGENAQKTLVKLQAALALAEGTKAIDGFSDSFKQLNLVMKENPVLFIAAGVAALGAAMVALTANFEELNAVQKAAFDVKNKAIDGYYKEESQIRILLKQLNAENISNQEKVRIVRELNKISPEYLGGLDAQKNAISEINKASNLYLILARQKAQVQAAEILYQEQYKKILETRVELEKQRKIAGTAEKQIDVNFAFKAIKDLSGVLERQQSDLKIYTNLIDKLSDGYSNAELAARNYLAAIGAQNKTSGAVNTAIKQQKDLQSVGSVTGTTQQGIKGTKPYYKMEGGPVGMPEPRQFKISAEYAAELARQSREVTFSVEEMNAALNSASADGLANMATAIGTAIATGQDLGQAIGKSFLTSLADFLQQMGKMMITTASIWSAFQKALVAQPELAIALGIAAVGAGAALRAHVQNGARVEAFASGGMADSPTFALIGDNLNAHNNPEFVLRQDQLKRMMSGGNMNLSGEFVIRGSDLIYVLDESNRRRNR